MSATANIGMTEPGHTKFNLSYPLVSSNDLTSQDNEQSQPVSSTLLLSLHLPHALTALILILRLITPFLQPSSSHTKNRRYYTSIETIFLILSFASSTTVIIFYSSSSLSSSLHPNLPQIFYQISLFLTKLGILVYYLRIFTTINTYTRQQPYSNNNTHTKRLCITTIIFIPCYSIPLIFMAGFQCPSYPTTTTKCFFSFNQLLITGTTLNSITVLWLIGLIIPWVLKRRKNKLGMGIVLSLGLFLFVIGITRALVISREEESSLGVGIVEGVEEGGTPKVLEVLEMDLGVVILALCGIGGGWTTGLRSKGKTAAEGHGYGVSNRWSRRWDDRGSIYRHRDVGAEGTRHRAWEEEEADAKRSLTDLYFSGRSINTWTPSIPPPAFFSNHTNTSTRTLRSIRSIRSIRSFMTIPRSRGDNETADKKSLLILSNNDNQSQSTLGFEEYYYLSEDDDGNNKLQSYKRYSGNWKWQEKSQESFVLGLNDPNSPKRGLSPVEYFEEESSSSLKGKELDIYS
ncbi:hypothetical protein QBC38DRAFT_55913 [Podospora fimiseda]|uniref:Rhodopsin domain-containing protein n=1 Tax=Podospora fimiseda TaxID=252190 RepID=A0AAN7H3Q6_9PEZI|nr:hypothetical protein QBC38DRAFT_55913 [Podospora fimiseda]